MDGPDRNEAKDQYNLRYFDDILLDVGMLLAISPWPSQVIDADITAHAPCLLTRIYKNLFFLWFLFLFLIGLWSGFRRTFEPLYSVYVIGLFESPQQHLDSEKRKSKWSWKFLLKFGRVLPISCLPSMHPKMTKEHFSRLVNHGHRKPVEWRDGRWLSSVQLGHLR